jgi:hypothetical protein
MLDLSRVTSGFRASLSGDARRDHESEDEAREPRALLLVNEKIETKNNGFYFACLILAGFAKKSSGDRSEKK